MSKLLLRAAALSIGTAALLCTAAPPARAQWPGFAFALETGSSALQQIERGANVAWPIGAPGSLQGLLPGALAWDEARDRVWILERAGGALAEISPWNGAAALRATLGPGPWDGLCLETGAFLALRAGRELWRIDSATFAAQLLGDLGSVGLHDLALASNGELYTLRDAPPALVRITRSAGSAPTAELRVALAAACQALAIDPVSGAFLVALPGDPALHALDRASGATTRLGTVRELGSPLALAIPPCRGSISFSGTGCDGGTGLPLRIRIGGLPCHAHRVSLLLEHALPGPVFYVRGHGADRWGELSLPFDLGVLGAPGCLVRNAHDIIVGPVAAGAGLVITVPRRIEILGWPMHWQGYSLAPGVPNPLGLASSDSIEIHLGR